MPKSVSTAPVTVMVELHGAAVSVAQAKSGLRLSARHELRLAKGLATRQAPVAARINRLGGKVQKHYRWAYNGLRVTIPSNKLAALARVRGVKAVHALTPKSVDNVHGVPLIGAPQVWDGVNGLHGEGIKIAVIDTGIDYTHADFGGPGTVSAYQNALATDTAPADPAMFGPSAPRVKGGTDLVGDNYNADPTSAGYQPVPHPDPNPLDCNGHGTHTAGTAAGSGVLSTGATYSGAYNATTVSGNNWDVGPGVAPKADLYSVRVFGCAGSTNEVVDAIEWAVQHGMDVINMSLGSPYGGADDPDAVAADNAADAGVIVVTSAGNNGQNPYLVGSPSTATKAISVAASDPTQSFPAANITLSTGPLVQAIDANGISVNGLNSKQIVVLPDGAGGISLGCDPQEYVNANVAGKIAVVKRGTCARVARAIFGEEAGAVAVIMVNNVNSFPPFEGAITQNPDDGQQFTVTIPFLGVPSSKGATFLAANGGTADLSDTQLANPGFLAPASFTSGGARSGDSALKPDVTAPGVSIASAGMGTGIGPAIMSGTSMASPHTAGAAALVRQAHPTWKKVQYWKAALVNTADPDQVQGYATRIAGSGLVQVPPAVKTQVVATATDNTATLSYGMREIRDDYSNTANVTLRNFGASPVTFDVGHSHDSGDPHSLGLPASVTVPAKTIVKMPVTLNVPVATTAGSQNFHDVAGLVTFTPESDANNGVTLRVPYYLVPQAVSVTRVSLNGAKLTANGTAKANVQNLKGATTGTADWYAWGLTDPADTGTSLADVTNVGVQSFPGDHVMAFAVQTANRLSNPAAAEYDIGIDADADGHDDYVLVAADHGALTTGTSDGQAVTALFDLHNGGGLLEFLTGAYTNGNTLVIPVDITDMCPGGTAPCVSAANPRITYHVTGFGPDGGVDAVNGTATYNVFDSAISQGMFDVLAPGASTTETVSLNAGEMAHSAPLGVMVLEQLNRSKQEAQEFPLG